MLHAARCARHCAARDIVPHSRSNLHAARHMLRCTVDWAATGACSTQSEKAALQSKLAAADKRSEAQVRLASLITLEYEEYP